MASSPRRARAAWAALAALALCAGCGGEPAQRERIPLVRASGAPLVLEPREVGREARPAVAVDAATPLALRAEAAGRLRVAA
ncbi:MAG TPA: hypothetical protein VKB65_06180, partial [Myxococcota bacterium]|nr:hypothetical protein [Myxococcota bacterium]